MRIGGSVRVATTAADDELPIFLEEPLRTVEFAPRALRPPSRRGPMIAGAWALVVLGLVGVGVLASEPAVDEGRPRIGAAAPPVPARRGEELPSTRMGALLLVPNVVAIDAPAPARVEVTTPTVNVLGSMLVRAARVQVALETRENRILDHVSIDVSNHHGGIRPEWGPSFQATFDLPAPRPRGTMWVVVTAYDDRGMPLGATRRPFTIGPLRGLADSNPMGERWRPPVRGGPGLANRPPLCLPFSAILASSC